MSKTKKFEDMTVTDLRGMYDVLWWALTDHIKATETPPEGETTISHALKRTSELFDQQIAKLAVKSMQACSPEECEEVGLDTSTGRFSFEEDQTPRALWQGKGFWFNTLNIASKGRFGRDANNEEE